METKKKILTQLKKIFDFYVFSNLHVALATFSLTKITLLEIGISDNVAPCFVFFSTLFAYNLIRFSRLNTIKSWFTNWFILNKNYLLFITLISLVFLMFFALKIRLKAILLLFPFTLFTLFYTFPVKRFALREKAGIKLFLIAISWAGITVLFPLVQNYIQLRTSDYLTFLQRFLFVFAITIPFDIRDLQYDKKEMQTIPQVIGVEKSKILSVSVLILFFLFDFIKNTPQQIKITDFIISVIAIVLIYNMKINRNKYYTSFFVEAIPILWLIVFILMALLN